jgi:plastocyanin
MTMLQALVAALLAFGMAATPRIAGPSVVEMTPNMTFMPRELQVVTGEVVVWKNTAEVPHTVNTNPENCKRPESKEWVKVPAGATPIYSGEIKPGQEFRVRFEIPGKYQYVCVYNEDQMMRGTVIVHGAEVK